MSDQIYLSFVIIDGRKTVVDQDGREVANLTFVGSESSLDELDEITIKCHDHKGLEPIVSGGHRG